MSAKPAESHSDEKSIFTLPAIPTDPHSPATVGPAAPARGPWSFSGPTRAFEDLPFGCRCGARWSGSQTCHCAAPECHRTFSGVTAFDAHRFHGTCRVPADAGMSLLSGRAYECWGLGDAR